MQFYLKTKIFFGQGIRKVISSILTSGNWFRLGIVVDDNLKNLPVIEMLIHSMSSVATETVIGSCTEPEPTYDFLEKLRNTFNSHKLDAFVGIGGGSTLDCAKAMAVLMNNHGPAISYRGFDKMTEPVLPIIAIPTTAGTGSEVTPNASFIDTEESRKLGINGDAIRPSYAILDPELTLSLPLKPTVSSGADALVHAVEAYVAKATNPMARLFAREGFKCVFNALPRLVNNLDDIQLRTEVMFGAHLAGIALMHSGTGPAAALSYPLGVHFRVPHGIAGAVFLPHVIEFNIKNGYTDYFDLYEGEPSSFLNSFFDVWKRIGIPSNLRAFGVTEGDIPRLIEDTMELKAALDQNPVPFYEKEIETILKKLLEAE